MSTRPEPTELLTSLQAGRAIAALLVLLYHESLYIFALDKYWGYDPTGHFFDFSHAGVEFFFVLSGFIILYIHQQDLGRPSRFFSYAVKRFLRIYPVYWIVLAGVTCVYFLIPSFGHPYHREMGTMVSSILLVHVNGNENTELAVAWTLYHEVLFYSVFAMAIFHKRLGFIVMSLWMLASASTLMIKPDSYALAFLFSPLQLLFGMGMVACWITSTLPVPSPGILLFSGIVVFMAAGIEEDYAHWLGEMPRDIIYGFASALMLTGIVPLERRRAIKAPAPLLLMGNASYVLYLVHFALLSFLAKLFIHMGAKDALPALVSYMLIMVAAVCLGIAAHRWMERPLLRFLRKCSRKHGSMPAPPDHQAELRRITA